MRGIHFGVGAFLMPNIALLPRKFKKKFSDRFSVIASDKIVKGATSLLADGFYGMISDQIMALGKCNVQALNAVM
jgi:hypothetical protein